jgi:hypothetical protein
MYMSSILKASCIFFNAQAGTQLNCMSPDGSLVLKTNSFEFQYSDRTTLANIRSSLIPQWPRFASLTPSLAPASLVSSCRRLQDRLCHIA